MLEKRSSESDQSITSRLALLDRQDTKDTTRNFSIELFLVEFLLPSTLLRVCGFVATYLLNLA